MPICYIYHGPIAQTKTIKKSERTFKSISRNSEKINKLDKAQGSSNKASMAEEEAMEADKATAQDKPQDKPWSIGNKTAFLCSRHTIRCTIRSTQSLMNKTRWKCK